jgi:hypothetical protein
VLRIQTAVDRSVATLRARTLVSAVVATPWTATNARVQVGRREGEGVWGNGRLGEGSGQARTLVPTIVARPWTGRGREVSG